MHWYRDTASITLWAMPDGSFTTHLGEVGYPDVEITEAEYDTLLAAQVAAQAAAAALIASTLADIATILTTVGFSTDQTDLIILAFTKIL